MENRRPPRSNSSGRKSYLDRGRSASSFRDGNTLGGGQNRKPIRSSERSRDGKSQDRTARTGDSWRKDSRGGFNRKDSNRTGPGRYEQKAAGRSRTRPDRRDPRENEVKITSDAQITDGKLRGRTLVNTVSPHAVHTKRKLREVAFKIISRRVKAGRILDLGAGCGTIGIEAISRGAMLATFVERSGRTCSFLRRNLTELGIKDGHGEVVEMEILPFLIRAGRRKRCWDIVYFNIPESEERRVILDQLACGCALKTGGLLLFEHGPPASFPDQLNQLKRWRTVDQGETILSIYERI
ncbi:MAG TPA: RsmD family RNA methyltransferase [Pyrinomonadaceae bacterium]